LNVFYVFVKKKGTNLIGPLNMVHWYVLCQNQTIVFFVL